MTSVNNNNYRFYQFLSNHDLSDADANGDGAIELNEFQEFLKNSGFNFDSLNGYNGSNGDDLVKKFFSSFEKDTGNKKNLTVDDEGNVVALRKKDSNKTRCLKNDEGSYIKSKGTLDTDEQNNMQIRIIAYSAVAEFVEGYDDIPESINQDKWIQRVIDELMTIVEKDKSVKNIEDLNKIGSAAQCTAKNNMHRIAAKVSVELIAETYCDEKFAEYAQKYGYDYTKDTVLQGMLNNFVKILMSDTVLSADEIEQQIHDLIDNYIATAVIDEGTGITAEDVAEAKRNEEVSAARVWNASTALNPLQKTVLEKTLKTRFEAEKSTITSPANYEDYATIYDKAISEFISELLSSTKADNFDDVLAYGISEFQNSAINKKWPVTKKTLEANIAFSTNGEVEKDSNGNAKKDSNGNFVFKNGTSELYKELYKISPELAEMLQKGGNEVKIFKTIKDGLIERAVNGEFDKNGSLDTKKLVEEIVKQIKDNLNKLFENGFGDVGLNTLNELYKAMITSAEQMDNDEEKVKAKKQAAINYCDAVARKNEKFKAVLDTIFDGDYKTKINSSYTYQIDELMNKLQTELNKLGDASEMTLGGLSDNLFNVTLSAGTSETIGEFLPVFTVNGKAQDVDSSRVKIEFENSNVFKIEGGKLVVNAAGLTQGDTVTSIVKITVDGVVVGTKNIKLTVSENLASKFRNEEKVFVQGISLKQLLDQADGSVRPTVWLGNDYYDWNTAIEIARRAVGDLLGQIKGQLLGAGYPSAKVEAAINATYSYYIAAINGMSDIAYDNDDHKEKYYNITYTGPDGQSRTEGTSHRQYTDCREHFGEDYQNWCATMSNNSSGLNIRESYYGANSYVVMLNTAVLVNRVMSFLSMI